MVRHFFLPFCTTTSSAPSTCNHSIVVYSIIMVGSQTGGEHKHLLEGGRGINDFGECRLLLCPRPKVFINVPCWALYSAVLQRT